jgi:two-component system OmpR family response regulator
MPGGDGPGLLAPLRERTAAPVVFLTAMAQRHELARLRALGAAGVVAKPFDPMTLAAELERTLGEAAR